MSEPESVGMFLDKDFWARQLEAVIEQAQNAGWILLYALIVTLIAWIVIKIILWLVGKALDRMEMEDVAKNFILSTLKFFLWMIAVIQILSVLDVDLVSAGAIVGALAFGVGMAIGNFMANFVGGIILLTYKHIAIGEFIEAAGQMGVVQTIGLFETTIDTPDNRKVLIPNGQLLGIVQNYSRSPTRRVDMMIGVSYDADLDQAQRVLEKVCKKAKLVLNKPATTCRVHELGDNSVNFVVRPFCKSADYWGCMFEVMDAAKKALDAAGIGIPYPQRDVHVFDHTSKGENKEEEEEESDEESDEESEDELSTDAGDTDGSAYSDSGDDSGDSGDSGSGDDSGGSAGDS